MADLETFLVEAAQRAKDLAFESNAGKLASERLGGFDRGVLVGSAAALSMLLATVKAGSIPRLEGTIEPAEPSV
jgi:hypothetical protein